MLTDPNPGSLIAVTDSEPIGPAEADDDSTDADADWMPMENVILHFLTRQYHFISVGRSTPIGKSVPKPTTPEGMHCGMERRPENAGIS